jgi:hypothetical protein
VPFCSNCGAEVDQESPYCSECGSQVNAGAIDESESDSPKTKPPNITEDENEGVQWTQAVIAGVFALVPAFIAYAGLSLAIGGEPMSALFWLGIPVFGYLLYQRPTTKAMAGGMCYYLAIESLLAPLVFLIFTFTFTSEGASTAAEQTGAALGGFALTIGAFVIGLPLALALYLVSRKLDRS